MARKQSEPMRAMIATVTAREALGRRLEKSCTESKKKRH